MYSNCLTGYFLIASPYLLEGCFYRSVIFICEHDARGAMGFVVNRLLDNTSLGEVYQEIGSSKNSLLKDTPLYCGGPVANDKGFVLHTLDYLHPTSLVVQDKLAITAVPDILTAPSNDYEPEKMMLVFGYSGWEAGQLDREIVDNFWLFLKEDDMPFSPILPAQRWNFAIRRLGLEPFMLTEQAGEA